MATVELTSKEVEYLKRCIDAFNHHSASTAALREKLHKSVYAFNPSECNHTNMSGSGWVCYDCGKTFIREG